MIEHYTLILYNNELVDISVRKKKLQLQQDIRNCQGVKVVADSQNLQGMRAGSHWHL